MTTKSARFDLARAAELYENGQTLREIAPEFGLSPQYCHVLMRAGGVKFRGPSAPRARRLTPAKRQAIIAEWKAGTPVRAICRDLKTADNTVNEVAKEEGLWPRERTHAFDVARAGELRGDGWTYQRIADELGVSVMTVWRALNPRPRPTCQTEGGE